MKKIVAWLLVLTLTAAVSIGATLAYLTDTDEDVNVMTLGKVKIEQLEYERIDDETENEDALVQEFRDNKPMLPSVVEDDFAWTTGDSYVDWEQIGKDGYTSEIWDPEKINNEVDKMVFIKNKGDYDAYVRSVFAFEAGKDWDFAEFRKKVHLNVNTNEDVVTWEWIETPVTIGEGTYFIAVATYKDALEPGKLTEISLAQIALDPTVTNEDMEDLGDTYNVLVKSQGIQADGFADAETALNEGFGEIATDNIPWTSDQPIQGIDVRSALRFYQGDAAQPIHHKVTNVVFGLNKDHPNIVDNYEGTLVTDEQDVDVYSYYVEEGDKYTVYFLANGTIYSPEDSSALFKQMWVLNSVDTYNYDVSRVQTMYAMFESCEKLATIDVSDWDTSNVTTMEQLFYMCYMLDNVDVSEWNVSNVTNLHRAFNQCQHLSYLDLSKWDVRKVTTTAKMFYNDFRLTEIKGLGNWKTESLTACNSMFSSGSSNTGNMKFTHLDVENWDMSNVTNMGHMFYGCGNLTKLDLSAWDVSNVTTMNHTFADCFKLVDYNFTGWNTESLTTINAIFNSNRALKRVDLSAFDTQNVTDFCQTFDGCTNLEEIIGLDQWDTSKADRFVEFLTGSSVREIDLSSFDTSSAKYMQNMFLSNGNLTTIYVGDKWTLTPDQLDTTSGLRGYAGVNDMITWCPNVTGANGTTPAKLGSGVIGALYARVDTPETPGLLTHINDKPATE